MNKSFLIWIVVSIFFFAAEIAAGTMVFVFFAAASIAVAVTSLFGFLEPDLQVLVFVSLASIAMMFRKKLISFLFHSGAHQVSSDIHTP